jgi:hypothetical protein
VTGLDESECEVFQIGNFAWLAGEHAAFRAGALSACRGDATANPPAPSEKTTPTDAAVDTTQMRVPPTVRSCESTSKDANGTASRCQQELGMTSVKVRVVPLSTFTRFLTPQMPSTIA